MMNHLPVSNSLPIKNDLRPAYIGSLVVAVIMAVVSLASLLNKSAIYPTEELQHSFVANDVANLFIGLPILLGAMWFARRGKLIGLLFWPGALFYVTYNYIAYAVAMSWTMLFFGYLVLVFLSVYLIWHLLSAVEATAVQERLGKKVPARFLGGMLIFFAVLVFLLDLGPIWGALTGEEPLPWSDISVLIADLLLLPAWFGGGLMLLRRRAYGYVTAAGLLFQSSMLFVGLFVFFAMQPILAGIPFPMTDFVVVALMSLTCFIPFGLFVRGVLSTENSP